MPFLRVNSSVARYFALILCGLLFSRSVAAADALDGEMGPATEFVTGADEVPLMELLTEIPGSAMVFDKPGGRIVDVQAEGAASPKQVREFYATVLPQLGWRAEAPSGQGLRFERENEILTINVSKHDNGGSLVLFAIAPKSSKENN